MKPEAVLFDWDGTLYDSSKLCFEIYRELFRRFGVGRITFGEFRRDFSGDYHRYQAQHGLGEEMWPKFDAAWYEVYYSKKDGAKPFANAKNTLTKLHKAGVPIGLVTNATKRRIEGELSKLGMGGYFGAVIAIEDANWEFKPSPKLINIACEQMRVDERTALYVGDMAEDVKAGKRAGAMTGVVTTGVHTLERLAAEEPDFIFADVSEVPGVFE
jgi:HAD superfamily hydrolase (TIGR01662 family)